MMSQRRALWALAGAALLLAAVGCFRLSRTSPPVQHFVLGTSAPPPARAGGVSIGLRRLELASHLNVPEIVVRYGANRVVTSEFQRWGGTLDEAINRVVAAQLASGPPVAGQPIGAVDVAPWAMQATHRFLIQLRVARFEGELPDTGASGIAHVQVIWDIIRPRTGTLLIRGATDQRGATWQAGAYADLVRGLEAGLGQVARDIGACLARFPNDSTPPAACGGG